MKANDIQIQLRNYTVREGYLYKRSRFMKEWRKRWIVLTMNFIFTFQSQKCEKPTEIIDLKEFVSYKCIIKKTEEIFSNYLFLNTKSSEYAFCTPQANQKWSWIVTIERLMDFKERGASDYNNIDKIRTQGFDSQDAYQHKRRNNTKSSKTTTFSYEQQQQRNLIQADIILQKLIQQQQMISIREEELNKQESQIMHQRILDQHYRVQIQKLNEKICQLEAQIHILKANNKEQQVKISLNSQNKYFGVNQLLQHKFEEKRQVLILTQPMKFIRNKSIQYLLQEFHSISKRQQLLYIVEFFLKIGQNKDYQYQAILQYELSNHKYHQNFIQFFVETISSILAYKDYHIIHKIITMLNIICSDSCKDMKLYRTVEKLLWKWSVYFTIQHKKQMLFETMRLLYKVYSNIEPENKVESLKNLKYLGELSTDISYRQTCQKIVFLINK